MRGLTDKIAIVVAAPRVMAVAGIGLVAAVVVAGALAGRTSSGPAPSGTPPEVSESLTSWPASNGNYANDRSAIDSRITSANVRTLKPAWSVPVKGTGAFGVFSSNPIATADTVYLQDLKSNVQAVDRTSGRVRWTYRFRDPSDGPNGVAIGYGRVVGATGDSAFALDADTGKLEWRRKLIRAKVEGIDMQPLLWNNLAIVSTVPGNVDSFYSGGGRGIVYALDVATGAVRWKFNTTTNSLWGNPKVNSGGGLWYPPAVAEQGRLYMSVANPAPFVGTKKYPNGSSRPGPNLYTNSLVALDGRTGKLLWYYQALPHDVHDYDLQLPPILASFEIEGKTTDVVVTGGKLGTVYVVNRATGKLIWKRDVGIHNKWSKVKAFGKLPVTIYPGILGGIETPMAASDGVIYAPVNNLCSVVESQGGFDAISMCDFARNTGELVALQGATGKVLWKKTLKAGAYGAATVVNDLVLTATFDGKLYAFAKANGKLVWQKQLPAISNSTPAVTENEIIVGAGFAATPKMKAQVIAYRLPS
jgi:glucose dehydrogenase